MANFGKIFAASLLNAIGDGASSFVKQRERTEAENRQFQLDEKKLQRDYALKQLFPEKTSEEKNFAFYQGLPPEQKTEYMNYKTASSPYTFSPPSQGYGTPMKNPIQPKEPRAMTDDERAKDISERLGKDPSRVSDFDLHFLDTYMNTREKKAGSQHQGSALENLLGG